MANRRFIDFPIAASVGDNDIVLIWQDGLNKQTTKATLLQGSPQSLAGLTDVDISALTNGQILQYDSTLGKWENVDRTDINLSQLGDVTIVAPANGQVLVYNSSIGKWENSSGGYVPYTGAVTTVNLGAQTIQAGSFVKAGGTSAQFLKADGSVDSSSYGTGTVTSVALTMPSAFSVGGSPITTAGTLAVTGAGTVGQYIRGDGSLADFPATTGGGSSVSYYLNGSVSQGTIGGVAYREVNRNPVFGAGTDISTSSNGYIANFITDAGDPNKLLIPAGNWNLETYFSANNGGGSPTFYVELYKYNGTTFTLIASSSGTPELIAFGTNINPYFTTLAVPETVLTLTDRLALRYYVNTSGRTITLHTENGHLCQVITTFTTGLTALNGLTSQVQFFAVGTSGTDFSITSATDTHTFNLPTASATNRGALSSADWTTFNNKTSNLGTVTSVGLSSATSGVTIGSTPITTSGTITLAIATASGSQNGLLSSTDWTTFNGKQNALTNPVTGTGTSGTIPVFTGSTTIGNSIIQSNSTQVNIVGNGSQLLFDSSGETKTGVIQYINSFELLISNSRGSGSSINLGNSNLDFNTNVSGNPRIRITSGGNVLVNSTSDNGAKFQVSGYGAFTVTGDNTRALSIIGPTTRRGYLGHAFGTLFIQNNNYYNGSNYVFDDTSVGCANVTLGQDIGFQTGAANTNPTTKAYITNSGNFGIGTTSPSTRLHVFSGLGGSSTTPILYLENDATSPQDFLKISDTGATPLDIMVVKGNGNVLIGSTSDSGENLQVKNGRALFHLPSGTNGAILKLGRSAGAYYWHLGISGATSNFEFYDNSLNVLSSINVSTGVYVALSDKNKKKDFEPSILGLNEIIKLKPTLYRMVSDSSEMEKQLGFIAQEVKEFIPQAYFESKDFIGLNYNSIIPVLVNAIKELKQEIDTLKN